jgi:hypothetical protein
MDIYAQDGQRQGVTGLAITIAHREVPVRCSNKKIINITYQTFFYID